MDKYESIKQENKRKFRILLELFVGLGLIDQVHSAIIFTCGGRSPLLGGLVGMPEIGPITDDAVTINNT